MSDIKIFENKKVRSQYDADKEMWYFSIVDIVGILTEQPTVDRARNYWKVLKIRLKKEGNESVTNCNQLKLQSDDGKFYKTDVGNVEDIFRLIQSVAMVRGTRNIYALAAPLTNNINHLSACLMFYLPKKTIFYFFM
jgi:hypothetical protein